MTGRVASVRDFGAFVDLGAGVQGLLHVSEMGWSRVSDHVAGRRARRGDHRQGPARRRGHAEDRARVEAAQRRSVVDGAGDVRGGPGAHRPGHAPHGVRRVRRARAGHRRAWRTPPRSRRRATRRAWAQSVPVGTTAAFEILSIDPEKKRIGRRTGRGRLSAGRRRGANSRRRRRRETDEVRDYTERADAIADRGVRIARRQAPGCAQAAGEVTAGRAGLGDGLAEHEDEIRQRFFQTAVNPGGPEDPTPRGRQRRLVESRDRPHGRCADDGAGDVHGDLDEHRRVAEGQGRVNGVTVLNGTATSSVPR